MRRTINSEINRKLALLTVALGLSTVSCKATPTFEDSIEDLSVLGLLTTLYLSQSIGCGETAFDSGNNYYTVTIFPSQRGGCNFSGKSYSEYLESRYNYFQRSMPSAAYFASLHVDCSTPYTTYATTIGSPSILSSGGLALNESDYSLSLFYRIEDPVSESAITSANKLSVTTEQARANYWATETQFLHLLPGYFMLQSATSACQTAVMAQMSAYLPGYFFLDGRDLSFSGPTGWTVMMSECRYGPGAATNQCATIQ